MPPAAPPRRALPAAVRRRGSRLLHAQCWAWGQDIKRAEGNLLLLHGLERKRPPTGTAGCSQYTAELANGNKVRLWGFGVSIGPGRGHGEGHVGGHGEGLYLNRFDFVPRSADTADAWTPELLGRGRRQLEPALLHSLFGWIAAYENWVERLLGPGYRQQTLQGWDPSGAGPLRLQTAWLCLAETLPL